jgi:hypothetical protein
MSTTTNLLLTQPDIGQQVETLLATNQATLDAAIAGRLTKSVAGSSDVTLTPAEARNCELEFTGALTGNIAVILPVATGSDRNVVAYNNTTGAYTLTVKIAGGTGIVVPQQGRVLLTHDGTNVLQPAPSADFITGLQLSWVSATAVTVQTGAAFIQSLGSVIAVGAAVAKTGLSLSNSTTYHVYLYLNAGAPDVEIVTAAPATAYFGTARSKTADTSRRYLGSIRTDGSGNIYNFYHFAAQGLVRYRVDHHSSPFRLISAGTATTETSITAGNAVVPTTSRLAWVHITNTASSASVAYFGTSDDSVTVPSGGGLDRSDGGSNMDAPLMLDSAQAFTYAYDSAPSGALYLDVLGYVFER